MSRNIAYCRRFGSGLAPFLSLRRWRFKACLHAGQCFVWLRDVGNQPSHLSHRNIFPVKHPENCHQRSPSRFMGRYRGTILFLSSLPLCQLRVFRDTEVVSPNDTNSFCGDTGRDTGRTPPKLRVPDWRICQALLGNTQERPNTNPGGNCLVAFWCAFFR